MVKGPNLRLLELYEAHRPLIYAIGNECDAPMEGPYLVCPPDAYWQSPLRVAFIGQQTGGWTSHEDCVLQMEQYETFGLGRTYRATPFWDVIRKLEMAIVGRHYCCAALNLNRYDQEGESPTAQNQQRLARLDFLLGAELEILEPNVVVFFTGPDNDWRLNQLWHGTWSDIPGFTQRQIRRFSAPGLPSRTFRTYHPNYLRLGGIEDRVVPAVAGS